jgi:outer membrane protein assembly factor BamB
VKPINDRHFTLGFLFLTFLIIISSTLVLTACQTTDAYRPTPPSFSLSHGKIYVMYTTHINNDSLAVFRTDTGAFLWKASDVMGTPVEDAATVYLSTETELIARDIESGNERWHIAGELTPSAAINGIVYARVATNVSMVSFSAFRANDGKHLWTTTLSHSVGGYIRQVEMEQDRVYVLTDTDFFVLRAVDGKTIWSSPARSSTRVNGIVYLSRGLQSGDSIVDAVREEDGKLLWSFHPPTAARVPDLTTATVTSDGVLCVDAIDTLYGLNIKNGAVLWSRPGKVSGEFAPPVLTANGVIYTSSLSDGLLAIRARDGVERWRFHPDGLVSELALNSTDGVLYATIRPAGPIYIAAVRVDGQFLWKIQPQITDSGFQAANSVVYQVLSGGTVGGINEKQHYTQIDMTATRGNDGKSLWSTHFPF